MTSRPSDAEKRPPGESDKNGEDISAINELSEQEIKAGSLPKAKPQTRYDLQILQSLRQIIRAVDIHSRRLKTDHKITAPQLVCLLAISDNGSLTASQIAGRIHLSPSTVVGILDRLEKKRLVRRARDSKDRRVVNVTLTEEGMHLTENAPSPLQDSLADALQQLPELEQATIALSLQRIADFMKVRHAEAPLILETAQPEIDEKKGTISSPDEVTDR